MTETIPSLLAEEENRGVTAIRSRFDRLVRDRQDMHLFSREFFYPIDSTGTIWTPLSLAYAVPHRAHLVEQRKAVRHDEINCS
jgi:hypothetical protein